MTQLTNETRLKYYQLFNEVSSISKVPKLDQLLPYELHLLYSLGSELIKQIYQVEFGITQESQIPNSYLTAFFSTFRRETNDIISEEKFLKTLCCDLIPILYYAERERHLTSSLSFSKETYLIFLIDFLSSLIKGIPESRRINLKTAELKRYSKTRLDLREEDYIKLETVTSSELPAETVVFTKACVFQVNRLQVLCGFFTESGDWRSERHVPEDKLNEILQKYQLVRRDFEVSGD